MPGIELVLRVSVCFDSSAKAVWALKTAEAPWPAPAVLTHPCSPAPNRPRAPPNRKDELKLSELYVQEKGWEAVKVRLHCCLLPRCCCCSLHQHSPSIFYPANPTHTPSPHTTFNPSNLSAPLTLPDLSTNTCPSRTSSGAPTAWWPQWPTPSTSRTRKPPPRPPLLLLSPRPRPPLPLPLPLLLVLVLVALPKSSCVGGGAISSALRYEVARG